MTERYVEYLNTGKLEERAAKSIYYWVMNTIEAIFWGLGRVASLDITLYANEEKIVLLYIHIQLVKSMNMYTIPLMNVGIANYL